MKENKEEGRDLSTSPTPPTNMANHEPQFQDS